MKKERIFLIGPTFENIVSVSFVLANNLSDPLKKAQIEVM